MSTPAKTETPPPSEEGVTAVTRALRVLETFGTAHAQLSLAELSRRTGMHRSTVLRLARTLEKDQYLVQKDDGQWRLGRAAGWLGACYQATFNVHETVEPVLRELTIKTGESASFYVREGEERTCLVRVEGPKAIRHHVRIGAALPLRLGAPGRVILAFSGEPGEPYEAIRRRGYHPSLGEREPEVSSVSAPVFGMQWRLLGSVCISGPTARLPESKLKNLPQQSFGRPTNCHTLLREAVGRASRSPRRLGTLDAFAKCRSAIAKCGNKLSDISRTCVKYPNVPSHNAEAATDASKYRTSAGSHACGKGS